MFWGLLPLLVFFLAIFVVRAALGKRIKERRTQQEHNNQTLEKEREDKFSLLKELALLQLNFSTPEGIAEARQEVLDLQEAVRTERGRVAITQAEVDAVSSRLHELEEIEHELESAAQESNQEVELLRTQQRELESRTAKLKEELDASMLQLDLLLSQLSSSSNAVEALTKAKTEMLDVQQKIEFFQAQIANLTDKYVDLKKAYDALDIEYAQLYEKQNAG